jgi:lipase
VVEGADGIPLATARGGDGGAGLLLVHATGFCKEVWNPVIAAIRTEPLSWLSMDMRGHGDSEIGNFPMQWGLLGRDVVTVLEGCRGVVGVGHSAGGAAVARAAVASPDTFKHLVLIEPIILPGPAQRLETSLSAAARKRRRVFESRGAARERFSGGPFADWTPEALDAYLDGGFRQTAAGFELKCSPEVEAEYFVSGFNHDTWDIVGSIDIPVTIVAGDRSTTHVEPYLGALADRFTNVDVVVLDDATHLMPMEDPQRVAEIIDAVMSLPSV